MTPEQEQIDRLLALLDWIEQQYGHTWSRYWRNRYEVVSDEARRFLRRTKRASLQPAKEHPTNA